MHHPGLIRRRQSANDNSLWAIPLRAQERSPPQRCVQETASLPATRHSTQRLTHGPSTGGLAPLIIRTLTPFCPQPRSCSRSRTRRRWKRWSRRYRGSALASNTGFRRLGKEKETAGNAAGSSRAFSYFFPPWDPWDSARGSSLRSSSFFALGSMKSMDNRWIRILRNLWSGWVDWIDVPWCLMVSSRLPEMRSRSKVTTCPLIYGKYKEFLYAQETASKPLINIFNLSLPS